MDGSDRPLTVPLGESVAKLRIVEVGLGPGTFYLPAPEVPAVMAGWPGHGWTPATYAFEVELAGGRRVTLPFTIAATTAPG